MKKTYNIFLFFVLLTILLSGCSTKDIYESHKQIVESQSVETEPLIDTSSVSTTDMTLSHTYTTRFGEINQIDFPAFSIDYPDGWTVTSAKVTPISEEVILTSDTNISVTYWNFGGMQDLTGPTRNINYVDVTNIADAHFIPGYVQETDYSSLGNFMVAKIKITGTCDLLSGGELIEIENGSVRYALLPQSEINIQEECIIPGLPRFSFKYGNHISLIANSPTGEFTEQEEIDVIGILSSFRSEPSSVDNENSYSAPTASNTSTTIDELWSTLKGTWIFEEYRYMENPTYYIDHTLNFQYIDEKPCMSKNTHIENAYIPDEFFYDFAVVDASHYNAYIYKKDSYGDESANWSDDIQLVWYSFDLSELSDGILYIGYHITFDNGHADDHRFQYYIE